LQHAPFADIAAVLSNIQLPLAGLVVLVEKLDLVVGLAVDAGLVGVALAGLGIHHEIKLQLVDVSEAEPAHIIVKHVELAGVGQRFIQRILYHVEEGLVLLIDNVDDMVGIFDGAGLQVEIFRQPFEQFRGFQAGANKGVLVFEIAQLVIGCHADKAVADRLFGEDIAIEHIDAIHRKMDTVALFEIEGFVCEDCELESAGRALPLQSKRNTFLHDWVQGHPFML